MGNHIIEDPQVTMKEEDLFIMTTVYVFILFININYSQVLIDIE